ncbi:MAG TPA: hypothetical protein VER12_10420 [Polyangiaceae bacterium]|nr:hypothetical protein [Polyangiaceae bacterium]
MSKRREDDSRPSASAISQRATVRDVPAAKYKDATVGTVAPRGLRGPSLLPGQGAPERIIPEEVELAVLRDAETLDGPKVARATASRHPIPESRAGSPTPVSVEVPRARSIATVPGEYTSTPPTPSARSIQSGTLMSIGSVDPRAPTELSLPSPRPLSVSERAAYLAPPAIVDRTHPISRRGELETENKSRAALVTQRPGPPSVAPSVRIPPRSVPAPPPSVRPSQPNPESRAKASRPPEPANSSLPKPEFLPKASLPKGESLPTAESLPQASQPKAPLPYPISLPNAPLPETDSLQKFESVAPPAQHFGRAPRSNFPLSPTPTPMRPPRPTPTPMRPPRPTPKPLRPEPSSSLPPPPASSGLPAPPQFQIHSQLDALPHDIQEDSFDLRSVSTQREPLAGRKVLPPMDWRPEAPASIPPSEGERNLRATRSSSPAVTLLVDRKRESVPPVSERIVPQRAAVPLSWVFGAAVFAIILALIVAFALRPSAPQQAASPFDSRSSAAAPSTADAVPRDTTPPSAAPGVKRLGAASSARPMSPAPKSAARPLGSPATSASAPAPGSPDANSKAHQSIY